MSGKAGQWQSFCAVAAICLAFCGPRAAESHEGDHHVQELVDAGYGGGDVPTGSSAALDALWRLLPILQTVPKQDGAPLLPFGTLVERAEWQGNVLGVFVTLNSGASAGSHSQLDLETLSRSLARPFLSDSRFGGLRLHVRRTAFDAYDGPSSLLPELAATPPSPAAELLPEQGVIPARAPALPGTSIHSGIGGPTANASRQPVGALTGVTVYVSAGHGWTAGASAWGLQRPVLLGMCEDYGNIDQLNYFAAYAFNAGATVAPLRPAGWQPIEVVLDQDDPGVSFTGGWSAGSSSKYYENGVTNSGEVYKAVAAAAVEDARARFTPTLPASDFYPVYCFTIAGANRARQTYRVRHNGGLSEITIDHREAGNGWVWLGDYYFVAGEDNYVEITNQSPDAGFIISDAIRWGGGFGDVNRPGPNTVSGYPRDEEAQRYWGQSEWGANAVGFDSTIWDLTTSDDLSDNVGAGARMAREMNLAPAGGVQVERWKRVHVEFHSNAFNAAARGQLCLITDTGSTTNQASFATTLSNEIDADMLVLDNLFEHQWVDRAAPTLTSSYGAISTGNNSNEFDATIVELAFHDNQEDAELLRDARIRAAMGRATVQGVVRFLHGLAGSQVPLAFAPDRPRAPSAILQESGEVLLSWTAPLADAARGDPATGYVVYQSSNGLGFGSPLVPGNVLTTTIAALSPGETRYFRIAATNAGGESSPSEVLAVGRAAAPSPRILIVNGFDRLRRQMNPIQRLLDGRDIERQIWRESNSFDYVIEHAAALAAHDYGFSSCANEAVVSGAVPLAGFAVVDWILGAESGEDRTLDATEQALVSSYLSGGGRLFASGADIGYDLISLGNGTAFAQNTLRIGFNADDAGTYNVTPAASGIFVGMPAFDFSPTNGAAHDAREPDRLSAATQALVCLNYVGGTGGGAAVQYINASYNAVTFGFPFECISDASVRAEVMRRVVDFLENAELLYLDANGDGDVDFQDFGTWLFCFRGDGFNYAPGNFCLPTDGDGDTDVDLRDFARLQRGFTGAQ